MKNVFEKSWLFLIVLFFVGNVVFTAETDDVKAAVNSAEDVEFEQRCGVVKINALLQRHVLEGGVNVAQIDFSTHPIAHNCSYYAIFNLSRYFKIFLQNLN